ncbi:MAG: nodulation protein NfeD [Candidatus Rokubacteria bacterium]|nr:nodulation protein NfeD [Candidatus Rokubacteria bacterium]
MRRGLLWGSVLLGLAVALGPLPGFAAPPAPVSLLEVDGAITPVTVRLVAGALERAQAERSQALIVQLDTPGGLERSMRSIVQAILKSEIPVIVYVGPTGARAASAGVFITMAGHVAAMAPATNIGAAHPVAVGGGSDKEMMKKVENDAAAFARTIATERGRNVEWAEKAVRTSVSATEREAVKLRVVDLVAENIPDLLAKANGRTVKTTRGPVTLQTREAPVKRIEVRFRDRFLALITDPNIAYILMMIGMLGLFFELSNPGVILPGVLGGISLILAFFAFQSLPINWAGLLLILFGVALLIAEIKIVSHGVLSIGGIVAMILGSMMLYDAPETGIRISWYVIVPTVGSTAGLFIFALSYGVRALYRQPSTGAAGMVGEAAVARTALDPEGQVLVQGELWHAVTRDGPVAVGETVRITAVEGLTLHVVRAANPRRDREETRT